MKIKKQQAKNRGFVIVTVLIFGGLLLGCAALTLQTARAMFDEDIIAAERLKIENAAAQASALAEEWLSVNIKNIAEKNYFATSAEPPDDPMIELPPRFFQIIQEEYPQYNFSCRTIDLHYADNFAASADKLRISRIPPVETPDGAIKRAYVQKVTVTPGENKNSSYTYTKSLRAIQETSGEIRCVLVGVTD